MVMAKSEKFPGSFYRNSFQMAREMEGSASSGQIYTEVTDSDDSSAPSRKCINLNSNKPETFGVTAKVLPLSHISPSERKDLLQRLRLELKQVRALQKRIELQKTNGVTVSSSSDILSCSNGNIGQQKATVKKSSVTTPGPVKKVNSSTKVRGWNRGGSGKFESAKQASTNTTDIMVMKQCEALLKRLMQHQFGWVFNTPVDVVKLNIPDYFTIIKHPMDLGTVLSKISSGAYSSPLEFLADVRLTFRNAMEYNPAGHDVHTMADTLSKYFEVRWKTIEKKLPKNDAHPLSSNLGPREELKIVERTPVKKRKITSFQQELVPKPVKRVFTSEEKHKLGRELESLLGEMPLYIINFLKEHCSSGGVARDDEIEIDIDDLSDDTLITLRKLLDDYLQEKQKNQAREPCEIEMLNDSGPSNSSMQQQKVIDAADDKDIDIGGNEPPVSSCPVEIEKDIGHNSSKNINSHCLGDSDSGNSSESEANNAKILTPSSALKVSETWDSEAQLDDKARAGDILERNQSDGELNQVEQPSQQKPSSVESDGCQDGDSGPGERKVSPEKLYRAAFLKNRFADIILKAREKTLSQDDKGDPEKMRREKEELELQKKKEKARLQAEAKAAEDARKRAEAAAAAEARQKLELEREAARQALLKMEKTVEINENSQFLEDLEMLRTAPVEQLPSSVDETSPDHSQEGGMGGFRFGASNPLEQLGLFMKEEDEEEDGEHLNILNPPVSDDFEDISNPPVNDVEEGEID